MIFEGGNEQSIKSWYPILKWNGLPNFGHFHTDSGIENFKKNYYVSNEIKTLYTNLVETINNGFNSANIRITGDPGAGKTSFVYSLCEQAKMKNNDLNDYVFYILHINKAEAHNFEDEIRYHIKEAWKSYFIENGLSDECIRINQQKLSVKDKINRFADVFKDNKDKFRKILIFVMDDVDLLDGEHVAIIADTVMKNLEVASVKKWIVLRDITYENYSGKTRDKIEQFFPDPFKFPTISLNELVSYRIKNTSGSNHGENPFAKNPFSKELCDEIVLPICEGSLRQGLSLLKTILEESLPKHIEATVDEKFIHNYLDRSSVNTLLQSNKLLNLHSISYRTTFFPIAIDIILSSLYHSSYSIIYGAVNECSVKRYKKAVTNDRYEDKYIRMREEDFTHSLKMLKLHGMIKDEANKNVLLTNKGRLHAHYALRAHYFEYCMSKTKRTSDDNIYWNLAKVQINHKEIVSSMMLWEERNKFNK